MPDINPSHLVCMLGDIAYLTIGGIIPDACNMYYRFNLGLDTPGRKVST
jgi:hypothetical protein